MFEFKVEYEGFVEWVSQMEASIHMMVHTLQSVAEIVRMKTIPYVPLDTSALEQSFDYRIVDNSPYFVMAMGFDAVDEKSGFHYAQYQHDTIGLHHPRRGIHHYLTVGVLDARFDAFKLIEKDYLSLFQGAVIRNGIGLNDSMSIIDTGE